MLSFIYNVSQQFEKEHGYSPNTLYMNYAHLECLKQQLDNPNDFDAVTSLLGMELVISQDAVHPSVAWFSEPWKQAVNSWQYGLCFFYGRLITFIFETWPVLGHYAAWI